MARKRALDPELAQLATERLARVLDARVLNEGVPRRAAGESWARASGAVRAGPELEQQEELEQPKESGKQEDLDEPDELTELRELPPPSRFGPWHVRAVVVLLLVGLGCAGWALLRARAVAVASPGDPVAVSTPATAAPAVPPTPRSGGASTEPTPPISLVVHVLGGVRHPGLVRLPDRSRVQDALDAAGGLTRTADPGELNLAQLLTDGEQIVVGIRGRPRGEVRDGSGSDPSTAGSTTGGVLDLNAATQTQLEGLPGVGPITAGKILAWRKEHHRFSRVAELQEVDGIGPKTYAQIAPHVRV